MCVAAAVAGNGAARSPEEADSMAVESKAGGSMAWAEVLDPSGSTKAVLSMDIGVDGRTGMKESRVETARKITLTYPAAGKAAGIEDDSMGALKKAGTERLQKQETWFPTVYTRRRTMDSKFANAVYNVGLAYMMALNAADYVTTREALKHEGLAEANPLMQPFVSNPYAFAAVKAGLGLSSYFIMKSLYEKNKVLAWALNVATNAALSYVVINNLKMIRSVERRGVCQ